MRTAVLGAGSWGTGLAVHLARTGHVVRLWAHEPEVVARDRPSSPQPAVPVGGGAAGRGERDG